MSSNIITVTPNPKQKIILTLPNNRILASGAVRAGKTTACLWRVVEQCKRMPGSRAVILRRTLKEIKNDIWKILFNGIDGILASNEHGSLNKTDCVYTFNNTSTIHFIQADKEEKLRGQEWSIIYLEQAEYIPKRFFDYLMERNNWWGNPKIVSSKHYQYVKRWGKNNIGKARKPNSLFIISCNTNTACWIYDTFIKSCGSDELGQPNYNHLKPIVHNDKWNWDIINFQTEDNANMEDIRKWMEDQKLTCTEAEYRRKVWGEWIGAEGLIYSNFNINNNISPNAVKKEFNYKVGGKDRYDIFCAIDPGRSWYTGVVFTAFDKLTKDYIIFDEIKIKETTIEDICKVIKSKVMAAEINLSDVQFLIDAAANEEESNGVSRADQYRQNGIYVINANKTLMGALDRINGLFKKEKIFIQANCIHLLEDIQSYSYGKDGKPDKGVGENGYDVADAFRYTINQYASGSPDAEMTIEDKLVRVKQISIQQTGDEAMRLYLNSFASRFSNQKAKDDYSELEINDNDID